jgi:hypothetical protein
VRLDKLPDGYRSIRYWSLAGAPLIYGGNESLLCIELERATLAARGRATNLFYTFHIFYVDVNDATYYNIVIRAGKEAEMEKTGRKLRQDLTEEQRKEAERIGSLPAGQKIKTAWSTRVEKFIPSREQH